MFPSERFISSLIKIRHWGGGGGGGVQILYKKNPAFILGEKLAATVERGSFSVGGGRGLIFLMYFFQDK
jgi:hypothetical protein